MMKSTSGRIRPVGWSVMLGATIAGSALAGSNPPPCYETFQRSCAALHANTSRVCHNGANAIPCGDVIVEDNQIPDVTQAKAGEPGKRDVDGPTEAVSVQVDVWRCDPAQGSAKSCVHVGVQEFTCQGRQAKGAPCAGGQ